MSEGDVEKLNEIQALLVKVSNELIMAKDEVVRKLSANASQVTKVK